MPTLYCYESSYPKLNAQRNLQGRTHYVDDDTLKGCHSRIISAHPTHGGLLFAIVMSDAKDYQNRTRGFSYVIFDIFGTVVDHNPAKVDGEWFTSSARAEKAMWAAINALDAVGITFNAIERERHAFARGLETLAGDVRTLIDGGKVKHSSRVA